MKSVCCFQCTARCFEHSGELSSFVLWHVRVLWNLMKWVPLSCGSILQLALCTHLSLIILSGNVWLPTLCCNTLNHHYIYTKTEASLLQNHCIIFTSTSSCIYLASDIRVNYGYSSANIYGSSCEQDIQVAAASA